MPKSVAESISAASSKVNKTFGKPLGTVTKKKKSQLIHIKRQVKRIIVKIDKLLEDHDIQSAEVSLPGQRWMAIQDLLKNDTRPVDLKNVLSYVQLEAQGTLITRENMGFARLLTPMTVDNQVRTPSTNELKTDMCSQEKQCVELQLLSEKLPLQSRDEDTTDFMLRLDKRIEALMQESYAASGELIRHIVTRACKILFASQWEHATPEFKKQYVHAAFQAFKREDIQHIFVKHHGKDNAVGAEARNAVEKEQGLMLAAFQKYHEKHRTQRTMLLRMYLTFGSAVLLDPVWDLVTEGDLPSHSSSLTQTFEYIRKEVSSTDTYDLADLKLQSRNFLMDYLEQVSEPKVAEWMNDFYKMKW
jgi:hypothetical protein